VYNGRPPENCLSDATIAFNNGRIFRETHGGEFRRLQHSVKGKTRPPVFRSVLLFAHFCEVCSAMIALLIALLSVMSGGSHAAAIVNQAAPAAAHSQAVKRISLPSTGHPLAG
jgi:hypothetical protein